MARTTQAGPAVVLAVAALGVLGCGGEDEDEPAASGDTTTEEEVETTSDAEQTSRVSIDDFEFKPAEFSVEAGEKVTVTNDDTAAHTLSAEEAGDFDTGPIQAGGKKGTFTVAEPGTYPFVCEFHPTMTGTVTAVE